MSERKVQAVRLYPAKKYCCRECGNIEVVCEHLKGFLTHRRRLNEPTKASA